MFRWKDEYVCEMCVNSEELRHVTVQGDIAKNKVAITLSDTPAETV